MNPDAEVPPHPTTPPNPDPLFRPLPLMGTYEQAEALALKENDLFYVSAFLLLQWLQGLSSDAIASYAETKDPRKRGLQNGHSWRAFDAAFGDFCQKHGHARILWHLFRLAVSSNGDGNLLRKALAPLVIESRCTNDYLWFDPAQPVGPPAQEQDRLRRTVVRWCDWLDAALHLWAHSAFHNSPALFDPDPETRFLAGLGEAQRHLACLGAYGRAAWLHDLNVAAKLFHHSPKWSAVGKAMADDSTRSWQYPELDTLVILIWPLVKTHNWTYHDLLQTIRPGLKRPKAYPCDTAQNFATYCNNILGLLKPRKGSTAKHARPPGYEIAAQYLGLPI